MLLAAGEMHLFVGRRKDMQYCTVVDSRRLVGQCLMCFGIGVESKQAGTGKYNTEDPRRGVHSTLFVFEAACHCRDSHVQNAPPSR